MFYCVIIPPIFYWFKTFGGFIFTCISQVVAVVTPLTDLYCALNFKHYTEQFGLQLSMKSARNKVLLID